VNANQISDTDASDPPDHLAADYNVSFTTDSAPSVMSTSPANGAAGVAGNSNITVNFSETVNAGTSSFTLDCPGPTTRQSFGVSGSGTAVITLDPISDLPAATMCTVTVIGGQISDVDGGDPPDNLATNYVFSFTTPDAAPSVTSVSPADGGDHVAGDSNVVVNFSESVAASAGSFTLECPVGNPKTFVVSGSPGSTIALDPTGDLPEATSCTVTVIANQISDTDLVDPPDHQAANYAFAFTTDAAPVVTGTTPSDSAADVDPSSNLQIDFSEPVHVGSSSFTIVCDGTSQTFAVSGDGTPTIALDPSFDLPSGANCSATTVAANISDVDPGDPPDHPASNTSFSFTTSDSPPSVTSTSPADGATDVASSSNIDVTFSESATASASSFTIECPTGTPEPFTVSGSPGSTVTLDPAGNLPDATTCTVTVVANQISDADLIDPPDHMAANYIFSFTTAAETNTSPTVVVTAPVEGGTFAFGDDIPFSITVTDPEDGAIDCSEVQVTFVLGHDTHGHAEGTTTGCSGVLHTDAADVAHGGNVFGVVSASYTDHGIAHDDLQRQSATGRAQIRQKHQEVEFVVNQSGTSTAADNDGGPAPPPAAGVHRSSLAAGDWIQLNGPFNLLNIHTITYRVSDSATRTAGTPEAAIEIHQDSVTGPIVQTNALVSTGNSTTWTSQSFPISLSGTHELFLVFRAVVGGQTGANLFNLNWVEFQGAGIGTPP
jgi:methionine-rich copper-binding protein CopC